MKLKKYYAVAAVTLAAITSSQATTVFTDTFNYDGDLVTGGGWTSNSGLTGSNANSNAWAQTGSADFNYTVALLEGDVITMDANVDKYTGAPDVAGNTYAYSMEIYFWDGADVGTMTLVAGTAEIAVAAILTQTTYTAAASDVGSEVVFRYIHADQSLPGSVGGGWGETADVTFGVTSVPEPSTYALLAGLSCLAFVMVRRRRS